MQASALPTDILIHIAQSLDDDDIWSRKRRFHEVCSAFLHVALNRRYRCMTLTSITPTVVERLERLLDAAIAPRVRSLTLAPHFDRILPLEMPGEEFEDAMSYFRALTSTTWRPRIRHTPLDPILVAVWQQTVKLILPKPAAVETFVLQMDALDTEYNIQPLIDRAWQTVGSHITELRLQANPDRYATMLESHPRLPMLETLSLTFVDPDSPNAEEALQTHVAPFVNHHRHRLQKISLHFWTCHHPLDMAPFINALHPLPVLCTFAFDAPYATVIRSDAPGLLRLLSAPMLRTVYLCGNSTSARGNPALIISFTNFISCLASEEGALRSVEKLDVSLAIEPGALAALRELLVRIAPTLRKLRVRQYPLTSDELQELVTALRGTSHITFLALDIRRLTPFIFDVLYTALPGLKTLMLQARDATDPDLEITFSEAMRERAYQSWELERLIVPNKLGDITTRSIAGAIPGLQITSS